MSNYEVLPNLDGEDEDETLSASWTPNNGIRIQIRDKSLSTNWAVFGLTHKQAAELGAALLRWSEDSH